jgi:hypothetical protein
MPLWKPAGIALLGLIIGAAPTVGQSLADVARKEADRRKTVKEGGKVYTNKDLPHVPPPATPAPATSTVAAPGQDKPDQSEKAAQTAEQAGQEAGGKQETDKQISAKPKDREYWAKRMKELRDHLDRDQTLVDAVQSRINALTTDFVNRDDPAQRSQIGSDRDKALAELDRLKKQIVDDKRAIDDCEEEARRSGVPPGWLR